MDATPNEVRKLNFDDYSTSKHLEHAAQQARARNFQDFLVVDVDAHHYENESYKEVFEYIESPVIRRDMIDLAKRPGRSGLLNSSVGNQNSAAASPAPTCARCRKCRMTAGIATCAMTLEWMDAMGVDYACMFPTPMLFLGLHPQVEIEVALCRAYNRWLCERMLAVEPRLVSMLYIPFNDPEAAYKTVKDFGDKKGVVGFMVTSPRYKPVHDNAYMKTYALLEEYGQADLVPRRLFVGRPRAADDQPLHLGALARLHVVQHDPHDQLGRERLARALPEAEGHVDRKRADLGLLADAAARPFLHDAHLGLPVAEAKAERVYARDVSIRRSRWRCRRTGRSSKPHSR